ncbi:MAG: CoA transferase, partial [Sphingomonas bacterium]
ALEVLADPKLRERGAVVELEHPRHGKVGATGMGLPIRFSDAQAGFDRPAEDLGASNEAVFGGMLGLSAEEIAALRARGTI